MQLKIQINTEDELNNGKSVKFHLSFLNLEVPRFNGSKL